jgi:tetratricopeptide (TPR) repeat protein
MAAVFVVTLLIAFFLIGRHGSFFGQWNAEAAASEKSIAAELYHFADRSLARRALADKAMTSVLQLQTDLPEVHLAYAFYLYLVYRDYERARVQLAIATRGLPNDAEALAIAAYMNRRQGHFDQAIRDFNESLARDPHNQEVISEYGSTFLLRAGLVKLNTRMKGRSSLLPMIYAE